MIKYLKNRHFIFTFIVVIFLFSGLLKSWIVLFVLPIPDVTALLAVTCMLLLFFDILKNNVALKKSYFISGVLLFIFTFILMISNIYSRGYDYPMVKSAFWLLNILAFILPLTSKWFNLNIFNILFVIFTMIFAIIYFYYQASLSFLSIVADQVKVDAFSGVALSISEYIGVSILITYFSSWKSLWKLIIYSIFAILLIMSGARGPVILCVFILGVIFIYKFFVIIRKLKIKKSSIYISIVGSIGVLGVVFYSFQVLSENEAATIILESSISRFELLFSDNKGDSINARLTFIDDAISYINLRPILGYGIGSYGQVVYGVDGRAYPHNIILEIWFELGFLSLVLFLFFIAHIAIRSINLKNYMAVAVICFLFLNLMKSSSLIDSKVLFIFLAIGLLSNKQKVVNV